MSLDAKTKQIWKEQILNDYPNLHPDMVDSLLTVYEKDQNFIVNKIKELKKQHKGKLEVKSRLTVDEFERLNEKGLAKVAEIEAWYEEVNQKYSPDNVVNVSNSPPSTAADEGERSGSIEAGSTNENHSESV